MSDLDITISVDPTQAVAGSKKVADEVRRTEEEAKKAKVAFDSLSTTFQRLAEHEQFLAREAAKARQAVDNMGAGFAAVARQMATEAAAARQAVTNLGNTFQSVARQMAAESMSAVRGFEGMAKALKAEQDMLDSIKGPVKQHQQDMQVLNKLYRDGKVTRDEYLRAATRAGNANGISPGGDSGQLASIAGGIGQLNFKQAAAGANQFFQLFNQNLKLTDTQLGAVVDSATKFGAAGAQVMGPWGAAIGAIVGVTSELIGQIEALEKLTTQYKLQALADEEFIREMHEVKGILDGTAGSVRDISDALDKLYSDKGRAGAFFEEWEKGRSAVVLTQQAAEAAKNEMVRLGDIKARQARGEMVSPAEAVELKDSGYTDAKRQFAIEQYSKATQALTQNQKQYGDAIVPVLNAEIDRQATIGKLRAALDDASLSQREHNAVLKEYLKLIGATDYYAEQLKAIQQPEKDFIGRQAALQALLANNAIAAAQYEKALRGLIDAYAGADVRGLFDAAVPYKPQSQHAAGERAKQELQDSVDQDVYFENMVRSQARDDVDSDVFGTPKRTGVNTDIGKTTELTKKWRLELGETTDQLSKLNEIGTTAMESLGNAIGRMVESGRLNFRSMISSMLADLARLGASKAVAGLLSALGSAGSSTTLAPGIAPVPGGAGWPGFASGAYIPPGGIGGTDSQFIAFRKSPWESVHVNTPAQEAAYRSGGSGGFRVVQVGVDPRALAPMGYDRGDTLLLEWASRDRNKLKQIIT